MLVVALMMGVRVFVAVVCARFDDLIVRVCPAFLVGVLGVISVHLARLEILVVTCGGGAFCREYCHGDRRPRDACCNCVDDIHHHIARYMTCRAYDGPQNDKACEHSAA